MRISSALHGTNDARLGAHTEHPSLHNSCILLMPKESNDDRSIHNYCKPMDGMMDTVYDVHDQLGLGANQKRTERHPTAPRTQATTTRHAGRLSDIVGARLARFLKVLLPRPAKHFPASPNRVRRVVNIKRDCVRKRRQQDPRILPATSRTIPFRVKCWPWAASTCWPLPKTRTVSGPTL